MGRHEILKDNPAGTDRLPPALFFFGKTSPEQNDNFAAADTLPPITVRCFYS
jgi:hypothetical protein